MVIAARTEPRPPKFGGPGFGRAKLLLSRDGHRGSDGASPSHVWWPRFREGEAPAEPVLVSQRPRWLALPETCKGI